MLSEMDDLNQFDEIDNFDEESNNNSEDDDEDDDDLIAA